ncbi:MAG TPA: hypothetical protein VHX39_14370 [Acetobacteraceae bacterium]|jgi:uncharacterized membrane protein (DUF485 family)|nr:hypothetical protein [Acetobacteraceae bacterium]
MFISKRRGDVTTTVDFRPNGGLFVAIVVVLVGLALFNTGRNGTPINAGHMIIGILMMLLGAVIVFRVIQTIYRVSRSGGRP